MKIKLTPQVRDETLMLDNVGDALIFTIDGVANTFDFSQLGEGGILPAAAVDCPLLTGDVRRVNGEIELTVVLPITWDAPRAAAFPEPISIVGDGVIALPMEYTR